MGETGGKYGVSHQKENNEYPLKLFMRCETCGTGYTGYVVKKKQKATGEPLEYFYYKCRKTGCNYNQRTEEVNQEFIRYLSQFMIRPHLIQPLLFHIQQAIDRHFENTAIALEGY